MLGNLLKLIFYIFLMMNIIYSQSNFNEFDSDILKSKSYGTYDTFPLYSYFIISDKKKIIDRIMALKRPFIETKSQFLKYSDDLKNYNIENIYVLPEIYDTHWRGAEISISTLSEEKYEFIILIKNLKIIVHKKNISNEITNFINYDKDKNNKEIFGYISMNKSQKTIGIRDMYRYATYGKFDSKMMFKRNYNVDVVYDVIVKTKSGKEINRRYMKYNFIVKRRWTIPGW